MLMNETMKKIRYYLQYYLTSPFRIFYSFLKKCYYLGFQKYPSIYRTYETSIFGKGLKMGGNSYINSGSIVSDEIATVTIGKWCAIGRNVSIIAKTHDSNYPHSYNKRAGIVIGDYVWIGNGVVILPNVTIGNHAVIGANCVIMRDVLEGEIVGFGKPVSIRFKTREQMDKQELLIKKGEISRKKK